MAENTQGFELEEKRRAKNTIFERLKELRGKEEFKLNAEKPPLFPLTRTAISGGGVKGGAYAGIVKAMQALGVTKTTTEYCGASAGAITAFLIGLGSMALSQKYGEFHAASRYAIVL